MDSNNCIKFVLNDVVFHLYRNENKKAKTGYSYSGVYLDDDGCGRPLPIVSISHFLTLLFTV